MRIALFLLAGLGVAGCAGGAEKIGSPRPQVLRDVEGYAIASCLTYQAHPYLKEQGDAWASVIIQAGKGPVDVLAGIAEQVKRELSKGEMAVIRSEAEPGKGKALPVLYCGEIIDKPSVRDAIMKAVAALNRYYGNS